jgi:hypothetical protein
VKRSYGSTKPERRGRKIRIITSGQCVGHVIAPSLKAALQLYYKERLKPFGFIAPQYIGNFMSAILVPPDIPPGEYPAMLVTATALEARS